MKSKIILLTLENPAEQWTLETQNHKWRHNFHASRGPENQGFINCASRNACFWCCYHWLTIVYILYITAHCLQITLSTKCKSMRYYALKTNIQKVLKLHCVLREIEELNIKYTDVTISYCKKNSKKVNFPILVDSEFLCLCLFDS